MKKLRLIELSILALLFTACSTTLDIYPVEGPLADDADVPVLKAKANGIMGNSGTVSLTLPDGEFCEGRWSSIAPQAVGATTGMASGYGAAGMQSAWASVYGSSFAFHNKPGVNRGEAVLVGDRGTRILVEFLTGSGTANGVGVATDNRGNTYKVLF